ncbi:MAG: hypothetical protein IT373_33400 [Polyangiaceae bacterium]|nr:hypothetical protein [Polyangiaceae bacterium]
MDDAARARLARLMTRGVGRQVTLVGPDGEHAAGEVRTERYDARARVLRAVRAAVLCLAAAAVSVLIPVAHFVLVPCFVLACPVAAWKAYRPTRMVLGGHGSCPSCGADLVIQRAEERFPLRDVCTACRVSVTIELARTRASPVEPKHA